MKKRFLAMFVPAFALVLGMAVVGCDNVTTGGEGGGTPVLPSRVYESTDGTYDYKLEIIEASAGRAAYTPKTGDTYVLTINPGNKISKGTVTVTSEVSFELKPSNAPAATFTVTVNVTNSGAVITEITGTITLTTGDRKDAPERLSQYSDGSPISGSNITTGATVMYPEWANPDINEAKSRTNFGYAHFSGDAAGQAPVLLSECIIAPASAEIVGGKATIKLGEPKPAYLKLFSDLYEEKWEEFASPKGVKGCFLTFSTSDDKYQLHPIYASAGYMESYGLVYVDKDVTIKGKWEGHSSWYDGTEADYEVVCDISLTKGWNYVITTYDDRSTIHTMTSSKSLTRGNRWSVWGKF
jgi:hypothetical protein